MAPLGVARSLDLDQPIFGAFDGLVDHAAVEFNLLFTWTSAHPGAAGLTLQVRPSTYQARAQILQARKLHLKFALVAAGALGEYLKNQQRPIIHRKLQHPLKIALLART